MFALKRSISLSHDKWREHPDVRALHEIGRGAPFLSAGESHFNRRQAALTPPLPGGVPGSGPAGP
jgi:hypothetical protein